MEKSKLHPNNKHQDRYEIKSLVEVNPALKKYVTKNIHDQDTIEFANPLAVKELNKSLLIKHYKISEWDIPEGYLCPPVPGRADYIHYASELLLRSNFGAEIKGDEVKVLDIGTGANCIYPIVGTHEYDWNFIGSDIDEVSLESAKKIVSQNSRLEGKVELRHQTDKKRIFKGILGENEKIHLSVCNPPFHESAEDALKGSKRKLKNLGLDDKSPVLNFGGQSNELWYPGGEKRFVNEIIYQSKSFAQNCLWFTTLVSKENYLKGFEQTLKEINAREVKIIPMGQGNKVSRILAWSFQNAKQQKEWFGEEK